MKSAIQNLACLIFASILAYFLAGPIQGIYCSGVGTCTGGFFGFDLSILAWLPLTYIFFNILLFVNFEAKYKYIWIGISLLPALLFEVVVDPFHVYIPIVVGLIAWWLGTMANKALWKFVPSFMTKIL